MRGCGSVKRRSTGSFMARITTLPADTASRIRCLRFSSGRAGIEDGREATNMVDFENRSGAYVLVREHRKRREPPFAGRPHRNFEHLHFGLPFFQLTL